GLAAARGATEKTAEPPTWPTNTTPPTSTYAQHLVQRRWTSVRTSCLARQRCFRRADTRNESFTRVFKQRPFQNNGVIGHEVRSRYGNPPGPKWLCCYGISKH